MVGRFWLPDPPRALPVPAHERGMSEVELEPRGRGPRRPPCGATAIARARGVVWMGEGEQDASRSLGIFA